MVSFLLMYNIGLLLGAVDMEVSMSSNLVQINSHYLYCPEYLSWGGALLPVAGVLNSIPYQSLNRLL